MKWYAWVVTILFAVSLVLRLMFILNFPLYNDESIYIRWGQIMVSNRDHMFTSLTTWGKQTIPFWFFGLGVKITGNPIGGRMAAFIAGCLSFVALMFLMQALRFSKRSIVAALFLYSVLPFGVFHGSLALMESFLIPSILGTMYFLVLYRKNQKLSYIIMLGCLAGFILHTKITLVHTVLLVLVWIIHVTVSRKLSRKKTVGDSAVFLMIVIFIMSPLFFGNSLMLVFKEALRYSLSLSELSAFPLDVWFRNVVVVLVSLLIYFSPFVGLLFLPFRYSRAEKFILLNMIFIVLPLMVLGKIFMFRYVAPGIVLLLPVFSERILALFGNNRFGAGIIMLCILIWSGVFLMFPERLYAIIPADSMVKNERDYALGYTSGYVAREILGFLNPTLPKLGTTVIGVTDIPGNPLDYIHAEYYSNPHVWLLFISTPDEIVEVRQKLSGSMYFLSRETVLTPEMLSFLEPLKSFTAPGDADITTFYRVK